MGTDYITFKNMTFSATNGSYSLVFSFRGGLKNVTIANCVLNGLGTTGSEYNNSVLYSDDAQFTNLVIRNNVISGGRSGVWIRSNSGNYATGTRITNNKCSGQYYDAVYLRYHVAPVVEHNSINMSTGYSIWAIYMYNCTDNLLVRYNRVKTNNYEGGIYIYYCDGTTSKRGLIANNFVECGGTSDGYGIALSYSNYQRVFYNTVRITTTNTSYGQAFNNYYGGNIEVKNNIFANMGGGYAYYANNTTAITASDYNDLFTTGNYLAYYNSGNRLTLADLQAQSGMDANSISANPSFVSATDMHTTSYYLDGTGTVLAQVTDDIDGQPRDASHPDIGADEFAATTIPLEGTYTIGGTTPDYATFTAAVADLNTMGIMGNVTFMVRNGTYAEHFEIFSVTGASATDSIVFQAESGDSTKVILTFNAASSAEDYLVKLTGADYITFSRMTLAMTNSSYSTVIRINGNVNNLNLLNNIISGNSNASYSSLIYSGDGNITDNLLIRNNYIIEGQYGVNLNGNNSTFSKNVRIIGNIFDNQNDYGIYLEDQNAPLIAGNNITTSDNYYYGIYLYDCDNNLVVARNTITNNQSTYGGIYLSYCNGTLINQGTVINNYIGLTGNSWAAGIYLYYSEYQNIDYNSVNISSTYYYTSDKNAFYVYYGDYLYVKNNIFACTNGGYAYNIRSTSAIDESDYNDLYTTSENVAYWNGDIATLSALKSASGMDVNSISSDPKFMSVSSYIPGQVAFHKTATPIAGVTTDIEGHQRDASTPDIGAYEFYCRTPDFNIQVQPFCFGDSTTFIDKTTGIASGSVISWDFDGDFNPEITSDKKYETIKYLYTEAGEHTVNYIVQHFAGCNDYEAVTVTVTPKLTLQITTQGAYCGNDDGAATVNVTAGEGPFTYVWSNGQKTNTATGLAIGTYTIAVTDKNNCVTTQAVEIKDAMQVTVTQLKGATCGKNDGKAVATIEGGEAPYTYVWSNGEVNDTNSILKPGLHYVSVIDNKQCYAQGSVNIGNDGTGPQIMLAGKTDVNCFGNREGAIDLTITGGATPYDILWSNGSKTEDISNLVAGVYDVVVVDADSCPAAASFEIKQPPRLAVSTVIENAGCALSDGRAVAIVSGGTEPYFYSWSTGGIQQIEENLAADIYSVMVTDSKGCQQLEPVIINNVGGPLVTIKTLTGVTCADTTNGAIDINVSGGTPLYSYFWSPGGQTSQDISGLTPGTYKVRVTDDASCIGVNTSTIIQEPPAVNELCLVTVDSASGKNMLIWERNDASDISHFNIYRESSQKNVYQLIGQVPVEDLTVFTDSVADPMIRSWKYRISAVDVCGNESELSMPHKTIHLTLNLGLITNSINLIWDHYEGFDFSTYRVLRYTSDEGWKALDALASTLTSYTDLSAPEDIALFYVIEVMHPTGCTATELKAATLNASRSNRQTTTRQKGTGIFDLNPGLYNLSVYPNPSKWIFNVAIDLKNPEDVDIKLFDITGKMVFANNYKSLSGRAQIEVDLSSCANGMYYMHVKTDKGLFNRILIKE